jgi:hypothetical protein
MFRALVVICARLDILRRIMNAYSVILEHTVIRKG